MRAEIRRWLWPSAHSILQRSVRQWLLRTGSGWLTRINLDWGKFYDGIQARGLYLFHRRWGANSTVLWSPRHQTDGCVRVDQCEPIRQWIEAFSITVERSANQA